MKSTAILCGNSSTLTGRWYSSDPSCTFAPWLLAAVFATSFFLTQLNSARALADDPVATTDQTGIEFFEKQIRPLLVERCQQCHGEKKQWAGLRLDSRDAIIAGGDSGPSVIPGDHQRGELLHRVRSLDADVRMPPAETGEPLAQNQVDDLARWIAMGAPWPAETPLSERKEDLWRKHWSFQPLRTSAPPVIGDEADVKNDIDRFVLFKLQEAGLQASSEASRETLIVRATYDLCGLPPTQEEISAFINCTSSGALPSPFKFQKYGQSGLEISELFARTAAHADDIAVIRSMTAQVPNHEPSLMLMNCGDSVQPRPSVGSWVMYGLGTESQNLPGFIAMCPNGYPVSDKANWQSGFLPGSFQGTYIDTQYRRIEQLIENIRSPHATTDIQQHQLALLRKLESVRTQGPTDSRMEARIESFELAFRMQSEATDVFDIQGEPQHIHELYGDTVHGRQTLIARRLLERGVRYVQLWHGAGQPWDHHGDIEKNIRKNAGEIDQPISALLTDLKQRDMLKDTLVIWGGEFGRTPVSEGGTGRDYNHYGFTVWMAGGGVRGGVTYGATDDFGFKAIEKVSTVHDLHATILHLLGFDHERLTYRYAGRDFRLTDVHVNVMREIIA